MLGAEDKKNSTLWTQEARSVLEEVRTKLTIKIQCWKYLNRCALDSNRSPAEWATPPGRIGKPPVGRLDIPARAGSPKISAGAIPEEPIL